MRSIRPLAVIAACAVPTLIMFLLPPIAQDPAYHHFADVRTIWGIRNALNVMSNLAFLAAGVHSLARSFRTGEPILDFAAGVTLTALGSAYYHYGPSTGALFWDRLPMTFCFMSLSALVVSKRISARLGQTLLIPLLIAGVVSVIYWRLTEAAGAGDLRPYILVQFLPLIVLPLICTLYPAREPDGHCLRHAFWWYMAAKIFEVLDARIYSLDGVVSGHTLKHLAAGVACWWVLRIGHRTQTI